METNMIARPVTGSMVLALLPVAPQPRAAWGQVLPVSEHAAGVARHVTEWFLRKCQDVPVDVEIDAAILLVSELVTNAFAAASKLESAAAIDLSLRLFADHLLIEVIDSSPEPPKLNPPVDPSAEDGRGLDIVERVSSEWGYFPYQGRKIVYCILPITTDKISVHPH